MQNDTSFDFIMRASLQREGCRCSKHTLTKKRGALRGKCLSGEKGWKADRVKLLPRFLIVQQDGIRKEVLVTHFWVAALEVAGIYARENPELEEMRCGLCIQIMGLEF